MTTFAFYLAIATFFMPKKIKKIFGIVAITISGFSLLLYIVDEFILWRVIPNVLWKINYFGWQADPLQWLFVLIDRKFINDLFTSNRDLYSILTNCLTILEDLLHIAVALFATKFSFEDLKSIKENKTEQSNENNIDATKTTDAGNIGAGAPLRASHRCPTDAFFTQYFFLQTADVFFAQTHIHLHSYTRARILCYDTPKKGASHGTNTLHWQFKLQHHK